MCCSVALGFTVITMTILERCYSADITAAVLAPHHPRLKVRVPLRCRPGLPIVAHRTRDDVVLARFVPAWTLPVLAHAWPMLGRACKIQ